MWKEIIDEIKKSKKFVILTGSGVSAESGIPTFRGKNGLWKNFRAEELATPYAFSQNPKLVWEWYNWRREIIASKEPNPAHRVLASWEEKFPELYLITQNIDGLHQKAGSKKVIELHGNIWEMRCLRENKVFENYDVPLPVIPPICPKCNSLLRPNVVWFGESLEQEKLNFAIRLSMECDIIFVIGTSAIVQPAASIPYFAIREGAVSIEININETPLSPRVNYFLKGKAGEILPELNKRLL